jgi:hypothetical protein
MTQTDPALAYLARREVSAQWRGFLRALVETLDANLDRTGRDGLLRAVGARLGAALPLGPVETLEGLEARMNEALAGLSWGYVALAVDEADRSLRLTHRMAPLVATAGDAAGGWIAPVLLGLYATWLETQQGEAPAEAALTLAEAGPGAIGFRFGA